MLHRLCSIKIAKIKILREALNGVRRKFGCWHRMPKAAKIEDYCQYLGISFKTSVFYLDNFARYSFDFHPNHQCWGYTRLDNFSILYSRLRHMLPNRTTMYSTESNKHLKILSSWNKFIKNLQYFDVVPLVFLSHAPLVALFGWGPSALSPVPDLISYLIGLPQWANDPQESPIDWQASHASSKLSHSFDPNWVVQPYVYWPG